MRGPDTDADFIPDLAFVAEVVEWRGPAPFYFVVAPPEESEWLTGIMRDVTYGWGMIPVMGRVGRTDFTTSLWPRKGTWWVPLKDAVRRAEGIDLGDVIGVELSVQPASGHQRP
ncbi:DUF1905 domain-containing protein [Ornithinimicrobium pratense]|uniref:DUF1905 domain-containing protein n=1 Tax=Ornithinimicrobium pratense TaxID=2593973 RepID=A0A5J6V365_9MICO|nr:DUF1905 domain-containing protein [Ornithinimicrobium pratense]QFG68107.1 DUF1905 domain-containing protein [Ornithinimicrobium pratense]